MLKLSRTVAVVLLASMAATPLAAVQPDEVLSDRALEQRARDLSAGLRCLVCQNQSIDDSDAPLARDLRLLVRERLKAGDSDAQVKAFLVERYGEFVLLSPPLSNRTLFLWLAPLLALLCAAFVVWRSFGQRGAMRSTGAAAQAEAALSPEEQARLDVLMRDEKYAKK